MLHVRTLGELRLEADEGVPPPLRRKPLALLSYVARRAPRPASRTELATLFWGERGEDRARQSLRQTLLELKQSLGEHLEVDPETVRVVGTGLELDIAGFERDVASGDFRSAVERWKGDFFDGSEDIGGEAFRRWIEGERVALHRQLSGAMQRLIGDAEIRGDWVEACTWAERWASALQFDETAHLRLVEALRMSGRATEAATVHAAFATRIRTTLDVEPSAEFLRLGGGLADDLKAEIARHGRGSAAVHTPQFVGRGLEFEELTSAWRTACDGTPVVVLIEAEAGSGMTRLGDELAAHVGAKAVVLRGRGWGDGTPYSAAASVLEGVRDANGSAGASPEALAEIARLVPSLAMEFRHLPPPRGDETALCDGIAQTLAAISEEQPVLLYLDGVDGADEASRRLLVMLASRLTGRVLCVVTADEAQRAPVVQLGTLLETRGLRRMWLHALGPADVEAMVGSMVSLPPQERHALAGRLVREGSGLPHDISAIVASLVDDHLLTLDADGNWRVSPALAGRPLPLPAAVRDRMKARLDRLAPAAVTIAGAMAVLDGPTEPIVVEEVAEVPPDEAEAAFVELVDRRVLRESPTQPGRFEFTSPLVARAVLALVPATKRRAFHARAADVLVRRDMVATAERSLLPYHLARAEQQAPAPALRSRSQLWQGRVGTAIATIGIAALAIVITVQTGLVRMPSRSAADDESGDAIPVVALGRINDYRDDKSSELAKPLTDMLATNLGRVGRMRVVSTARMYELASQNGDRDTSAAAIVAAARRAGATELLDGALYTLADGGMRLDLRRVELATGSLRQAHSVTGATLFELADSGTARLAIDFGQATPVGSVADVTTKSEAAYRLYEQGLRTYYENDKRGAERLFEAALAIDSTFAMAAYYSALSVWESRDVSLARFARAARLATRTTDRERLTILARQAHVITSSPALRALADTLLVRYPDEVEGYFFTGASLISAGEFLSALAPLNRVVAMDSLALTGARALCNACDALREIVSAYQLADSLPAAERELRRWIRLQPKSSVPWHVLAEVLEQRGRAVEALAALQREASFDPSRSETSESPVLEEHQIYSGAYVDADRGLREWIGSGNPHRKREGLWYLTLSYRQQGRLAEALATAKEFRVAVEAISPRTPGTPRNAAPTQTVMEAQVLFEMGRFAEAAALFDSIGRWTSDAEMPSQLGRSTAWAMTQAANALAAGHDTVGLAARADSVATSGARSGYERDRRLHHHVRGLLFVSRGQDDAAIAELRRAIYSWNLGYTRTNLTLARALLRQQRPSEAIVVLQPALRGSLEASNFYVTRAEIHESLAQAWDAMPGAAARDSAAAHYDVVARAWSKADPAFAPRLATARQRLEALKR